MRRTVLHILSTSYSGSSLLVLLLNSQPGMRGLGEAVHLAERSRFAECLRCRVPAADCELARVISGDAFYGPIFDYYGGQTVVLVDASKSLWNTLLRHRSEPGLRHRCVLLSKAPHEFAASWLGHHPDASVEDAFRVYLEFYETELSFLWDTCGISTNHVSGVTYRDFTRRPEAVLHSLCRFVHVATKPLADCRWWETDSHIIGGNWLVNAQVAGFHETLQLAQPRDRIRYQGREHSIFYDESWKNDREFLRMCLPAYDRFGPRLNPVLQELGQPPVELLHQDVFRALSPAL